MFVDEMNFGYDFVFNLTSGMQQFESHDIINKVVERNKASGSRCIGTCSKTLQHIPRYFFFP